VDNQYSIGGKKFLTAKDTRMAQSTPGLNAVFTSLRALRNSGCSRKSDGRHFVSCYFEISVIAAILPEKGKDHFDL